MFNEVLGVAAAVAMTAMTLLQRRFLAEVGGDTAAHPRGEIMVDVTAGSGEEQLRRGPCSTFGLAPLKEHVAMTGT